MSSPSQGSVSALMPSFLTAAAYASILLAAAVNKDSIRRFITRSQPKHLPRLGVGMDGGGRACADSYNIHGRLVSHG